MAETPYQPDTGRTHWEGCWRHRGHHNCAVQEVERLRAKLQAAREKIHALDCWDIVGNCDGDSGMCTTDIERVSDGQYIDRDDVLAALGGDE